MNSDKVRPEEVKVSKTVKKKTNKKTSRAKAETPPVPRTRSATEELLSQRLTRGQKLIVADSYGKPKLRGQQLVVTSKSTVDCNGGGRCAGKWCVGSAIFVTDVKSAKEDKEMGWRGGSVKICLTHLKDNDGVLLVPPPLLNQTAAKTVFTPRPSIGRSRLDNVVAESLGNDDGSARHSAEVTWDDLADAQKAGDLNRLALLARTLKVQTEELKSKVISTQTKLIESITR